MGQSDIAHCERLEKLFRRQARRLHVCAMGVTGCPHLAEDAVQSAFYSLFRSAARPRDIEAYAFRAVRSAALAQRRRRPIASLADSWYLFESGPGPAETVENNEFKRLAAAALLDLSDDERETVVNHLYAAMTFRQIAAMREVSINTVMSWYRRGIEKLRRTLEKSL